MASPYAAGLGGFMGGFANGMMIGDKLKKRFDESAAQNERDAAAKEARDAYRQQVEQQVQKIDGAQPQADVQPDQQGVVATPVKSQSEISPVEIAPMDGSVAPAVARRAAPAHSNPAARGISDGSPVTERVIETPGMNQAGAAIAREQTRDIARSNIGTEREAVDKAISARMRNFYVDRGDTAMADKWEQYAESQQGKKYIKQFAGALKSMNTGDNEGFINNMVPILEDAYGEGFKIQNRSSVKDKEGNVTGANFEIRNTRTGEVTQNNITIDQLANMGMQLGSPYVVHKRWMDAQQAKAAAKASAAAEAGKLQMQTAKDIAVERARQGGRVELEGVKSTTQAQRDAQLHENNLERDASKAKYDVAKEREQVSAKIDGQIDALKRNGMSDEELKTYVPRLIIGDAYKKGASPEEAARLAYDARMKSDGSFPRKTEKERQEIIESDIRVARTAAQNATQPAGQPAGPASPAARGLPVLDKKTGQVVYR